MEPFDLRVHRSRAHAACHEKHLFILQRIDILMDKLGSASERSCKVTEIIPFFERSHLCCGSSHFLHHNGNGTCLSVIVTDGQGNTLALLIHFYNNKLSGLTVLCHTRRMHIHQKDLVRQFFCFHYLIHGLPPRQNHSFTIIR